MTPWTAAAKEELERYFRQVRVSVVASGADAAEVIEDLRRHLDEEAVAAKLVMVTEEDARRLLARIGTPELIAAPEGKRFSPAGIETKKPEEWSRRHPRIWLLLLGAVLPLITLLMEWQTGMCAGAFFDPIPTVWHFLLVAWVPAANALAWFAVAHGREKYLRHLSWANGVAIGVAIFYSLLFVPLLLPGVIAVVFFGWGLLPWTPVLSLVAALLLRRHLREMGSNRTTAALPGLAWGMALAWVLLVIIDAPVWGTRYGLHLAVAEEAAEQRRGLRWLRALGHEETLLRACYGRGRWADNMDLVGWLIAGGERVPPEKARDVYYRMTGRAFNTVPAPTVRTGRGRWKALDDWTWDPDQGGQQVGGRVQGRTMQSSRLDAMVDGAAALGYCEWTLEFKNDSRFQREARAQILLPPSGVVSRLTLWVNGEEREAAFAGRSQVREAYQKVAIRQRRDPVLITTCGPDRVLMQCFPVPPNGGVMKVRLGMTAPLQLEQIDRGRWCWPRFLERNFTLTETLRHSVWVEAKESLATDGPALRVEQPRSGDFAARGQLHEAALAAPQNAVRVPRDSAAGEVWTRDVRSGKNGIIRQQIKELVVPAPQRVVFVVDNSRGMEEHFAAVAKTIRLLPGGTEVALFLATDEFDGLLEAENKSRVFGRQPAVERLAGLKGVGGQDNVRRWSARGMQRRRNLTAPSYGFTGRSRSCSHRWKRCSSATNAGLMALRCRRLKPERVQTELSRNSMAWPRFIRCRAWANSGRICMVFWPAGISKQKEWFACARAWPQTRWSISIRLARLHCTWRGSGRATRSCDCWQPGRLRPLSNWPPNTRL